MNSPDYSKYSLEELYQALETIERSSWPERVQTIEAILNDPKKRKRLEVKSIKQKKENEKEDIRTNNWMFGLIYSFIGIAVLITGTLFSKGNAIEIESWPMRILVFVFFATIGFTFFKALKKKKPNKK